MPSIDQVQNALVSDFSHFKGDKEGMLLYLMELGEQLPALPAMYRSDAYLLKGCLSRVWLAHTYTTQERLTFYADSDTAITKGLASLLLTIWQKRTPQAILQSELYFFERTGLAKLIGSQRTSGFALMVGKMRNWANDYKYEKREPHY